MRTKAGVTILETLIYIALFSIVFIGVAQLGRQLYDAHAKVQAGLLLEDDMRFALLRIRSRVAASTGVASPAVAVTSTSLTLNMSDASQNPTTFSFVSGTIMEAIGSAPALPLTSNEIQISSLSFFRLNTTPDQIRISVSGTVWNAAEGTPITLMINDTAAVRR